MAELTIRALAPRAITAPAALWFEAEKITGFDMAKPSDTGTVHDPSFHEITYRWHVEGAEQPSFTAPQNMPPDWNRPDLAFGKQVVLFFPKPGTYRVTLQARDRAGQAAEATHRVEVRDPDQVYPGTRTILVSARPDEDWAGTDPDWQRITDIRAIPKALRRAGGPARLLFRRGDDLRGLATRLKGHGLAHIGAWGTGPRPVLRPAFDARPSPLFRFGKGLGMGQVTVTDLDFQGDWDSTTETGTSPPSPVVWRDVQETAHYTIWNCRFDGFDHVDVQVAKGVASRICVGNSSVGNWRNYGFLLRSAEARFGLVGCRIAQHPNALHGGPKDGHLWNNHGPLRISDCGRVYIGTCDIFSRSGWSPLQGERADQPCLRLNTSGRAGPAMVVERVVCEGGYQVINLAGSHAGTEENPGNYLIDRALLIASAKTIGPFIAVDFGGLTARNLIAILPDAPRRHSIRWLGGLRTNLEKPGPGNAAGPLKLYSSSFLNLLSAENGFDKAWELYQSTTPFTDLLIENNLLESPETETVFDRLSTIPGVQTRFRGVRYNFRPLTGRFSMPVLPGEAIRIPYEALTTATFAEESGPPTEAEYWQKIAERARWHMMTIAGQRRTLYAAFGAFDILYGEDALGVRNTGRRVWEADAAFSLKLDRTPYLPDMDRRYGSAETLPLPVSQKAAMGGYLTAEDAFLTARGATPSQGAVEPR